MSSKYTVKPSKLTEAIQPKDNQLAESDDYFFNRRCWTMIIVGAKGSGKSSLLLNLLSLDKKDNGLKKEFDKIYLVSTTARKDEKMDDLVGELEEGGSFYDDANNEIVQEIIDDMEQFNARWKKKRKPHLLVIFDDTIHQLPSNRKKNQAFNKLMTTNRHYNASIIITTQRLNELSSLVRSQADIVIFFTSHNKKERQCLCDTYDVSEDMVDMCCHDNHDFLTVSFTGKKKRMFKKFDEIC